MRETLDKIFGAIIGALLFLLLSPFFLFAVLIVALDSPGATIFRQIRVGKNGIPFTLFKLRTMRRDADGHNPPHTVVDDPRFSPICRMIRATGIDEVPQLWNLIRGDMTLIGPRPEVPAVVDEYTDKQKKVLSYVPGLFGISQLVLREGVDYRKKLRIENLYYPNRTIFKDALILMLTPIVLFDQMMAKMLPFWKQRNEYVEAFWFKWLVPHNNSADPLHGYECDSKKAARIAKHIRHLKSPTKHQRL